MLEIMFNTFEGIQTILQALVESDEPINVGNELITFTGYVFNRGVLTREQKATIKDQFVQSFTFDSETFYGDLLFKIAITIDGSLCAVPNSKLIDLISKINRVFPDYHSGGSRSKKTKEVINQKGGAGVSPININDLLYLFNDLGQGIDLEDYDNDSRHDDLIQMTFSGEDSAIFKCQQWPDICSNVRIVIEDNNHNIVVGAPPIGGDVDGDELDSYLFMYDAGTAKGINYRQNYDNPGYCPLGVGNIGSVTPMSSYTDPATTRKDSGLNAFSCLPQLKEMERITIPNPQFEVMKNFLICCAAFINGIPGVSEDDKCGKIIQWLEDTANYKVSGLSIFGRKITIAYGQNMGNDFIWEANQASLANYVNSYFPNPVASPRSNNVMPDPSFVKFCDGFAQTIDEIHHLCRFFKYMGDKSHIVTAILLILATQKPVIILTIDRLLFKSVVQVIEKASSIGDEKGSLIAQNLGVMIISMAPGMSNFIKQTDRGKFFTNDGLKPNYRYYGLYKHEDAEQIFNKYVATVYNQTIEIETTLGVEIFNMGRLVGSNLEQFKAWVKSTYGQDINNFKSDLNTETKYFTYQKLLNDYNSVISYLSDLEQFKTESRQILGYDMNRTGRGEYPNFLLPGGSTYTEIFNSKSIKVSNTLKILEAFLGLLSIFEGYLNRVLTENFINWVLSFSNMFQKTFSKNGGISRTDIYITSLAGDAGLNTLQRNNQDILKKQYSQIYDLTKKIKDIKQLDEIKQLTDDLIVATFSEDDLKTELYKKYFP